MIAQPKLQAAINNKPAVVCRVRPVLWWCVAFFVGMGVLGTIGVGLTCKGPHDTKSWLLAGCVGLPLFAIALLGALWNLYLQVVADETGLRWRNMWGHWRCATWPEVTDYYEKLMAKNKPWTIVETTKGKIKLDNDMSNRPAMREYIEAHATRARAHAWGLLGTRIEDDWPQTFGYNTVDNRINKIVFWLFWPGWIFWLGAASKGKNGSLLEIFGALPWPLKLLGGLIMLGAAGSYPALLLVLARPTLQAMRSRENQSITVSPTRIIFEAGTERIEAAWDEVTDYFIAPYQRRLASDAGGYYGVITKQGTFDFLLSIKQVQLLKAIIQQYARNAAVTEWKRRGETAPDVLGGAASCWSGGFVGVGQRIYHYRTRTNRAFLWFPTTLALMPLFATWISTQLPMGLENPDGTQHHPAPWMGVFFGALALWGWWRYYTANIRTDKYGITQYGLFGKRSIAWEEVTEYYMGGDDVLTFGHVIGTNTRIWFYPTIANGEELQAEIMRSATHSRTHAWGSH
ncbi:MAG: hypothetical protein JO316_17465 [Abitibacteriaceae bacterium]|nr:hypothetical protein [Abditibacteriaceae bacterium]